MKRNIDTALNLKALHIGYTDWESLIITYFRYNKIEEIENYKRDAEAWLDSEIPESDMETIIRNIYAFGEEKADRIKRTLELSSNKKHSSVKMQETIDLIKSL